MPTSTFARMAAWGAALLFWGSLLGFAAAFDGYSQPMHPVAWLGARGVAHAVAFDVVGFVLPGLLLAAVGWRLRAAMTIDAAFTARIGARLALISALAFALQGLLPLDPDDLESTASRLYATAWTLWWVAFVPGALLLAVDSRRDRRNRVLSIASVVAAALMVWLAVAPPETMSPGIAQRIMLAAWFGWWVLVARRATNWNPGAAG